MTDGVWKSPYIANGKADRSIAAVSKHFSQREMIIDFTHSSKVWWLVNTLYQEHTHLNRLDPHILWHQLWQWTLTRSSFVGASKINSRSLLPGSTVNEYERLGTVSTVIVQSTVISALWRSLLWFPAYNKRVVTNSYFIVIENHSRKDKKAIFPHAQALKSFFH